MMSEPRSMEKELTAVPVKMARKLAEILFDHFRGTTKMIRERNYAVSSLKIPCSSAKVTRTHPPRLSGPARDAQPWRVFYAPQKPMSQEVRHG